MVAHPAPGAPGRLRTVAYALAALLGGLGLMASPAGAAPAAATPPVPVLGLSGATLSLAGAARMPDGSILVAGRRDGRAVVARIRPTGRLDDRFGGRGLWQGGPGSRAVAVAASADGLRAAVEAQRGGRAQLVLLTGSGATRRALPGVGGPAPAGAPASVLPATFRGNALVVAVDGPGCRRCRLATFDAATGRSSGEPVAPILSPAPAPAASPVPDAARPSLPAPTTPAALACLAAPIGAVAASGTGPVARIVVRVDAIASCGGALLAVGPDGASTALAADPWAVGAALPGGSACLASAAGGRSPVVAAGSLALGVVDGTTSATQAVPGGRALPASLRGGEPWAVRSVLATGASHCAAMLERGGREKRLVLQEGAGLDAVRLAPGRASTVAARCLDHVLIFGTQPGGAGRQAIVQAVDLRTAQRSSASAGAVAERSRAAYAGGATAQRPTASAVSCARVP